MGLPSVLVLIAFFSYVSCYSGEYIPKSFYIIDQNGHKSDVVYFRSKRDIEQFPLLRFRRSGGSSSSSAQSSAKTSASSTGSSSDSGDIGGGIPFFPGSGYFPGIVDPGFDEDFFQFAGGNGGGGAGSFSHSFASSSSSSSSGAGVGGTGNLGYKGPILFSRFGEDKGTGVKVSSSAQGPRGAFSSSSSSIDSDGKIKYSVKSGKY